jgi:hypothetical protein
LEPIYFYIRRKDYDRETAKDLTQSFFTVFLENDYLKSVEPAKGKFRTFLLASLNHFTVPVSMMSYLPLVNSGERGDMSDMQVVDLCQSA